MKTRLLSLLVALIAVACDDGGASDGHCTPAAGEICTIVGTGVAGLSPDGMDPQETELYLPQDVTVGPDGGLYVIDWNNHRVRVVRDGVVQTVVGTGYLGDAPDGPARNSSLNHPTNVSFTADGDMIIAAWHNSKILRYDPDTDTVATICGTGARAFNGDALNALETQLDLPSSVVVMADGRIAFSDQANQRIRVIEPDGTVSTLAGNGEQGYSGDGGDATAAAIHLPTSQSAPPAGRIELDDAGAIYLADTGNHVVRKVTADGTISTIIGTGTAGNGRGADPAAVALNRPSDVAVDTRGNVYVADTMNHCVRRVNPEGKAEVFAGQCGTRGFEGDGGAPTAALLDRPYGVTVGPAGEVYIADTHNQVIRVVMP